MRISFCIEYLLLGLLSLSCQPSDPTEGLADEALSGEQLAQRYCGSCHLVPDPGLLDQITWTTSVLPAMGWRLGIRDTIYTPPQGRSMRERYLIRQANIFPDSALLSPEIWQRLVNYYAEEAPAQLPVLTSQKSTSTAPFAPLPVSLGLSSGALTTLLRQHPRTSDIYLGDGTLMLYQLSPAGKVKHFYALPSPVTDIHFNKDGTLYLLAAGNLNPHDEPLGALLSMDEKGNVQPLIQELSRPVHMSLHDLNQDGHEDIVISEFGDYTGRLSWFERMQDGSFQKHVLWENPGAVKTYVHDLNHDDLPDVVALVAQGKEGVYAFYNQGNGQFSMKPLLQLPPVFGSSDFALADVDQDGDADILLANGDNADLSNVLKPYHGVRVYRNNGKNQFSEAYFYPMYGATRLVSQDFDQDGDFDVAASAYFPNFKADAPQHFVYLENTSTDSLTFTPHTLAGLDQGRWLIMEPIQLSNGTGVMLGALNVGMHRQGSEQEMVQNNIDSPNLMILQNNIR